MCVFPASRAGSVLTCLVTAVSSQIWRWAAGALLYVLVLSCLVTAALEVYQTYDDRGHAVLLMLQRNVSGLHACIHPHHILDI